MLLLCNWVIVDPLYNYRSNREPSKREYSEGNDDKRKNIRGNDNIDVFSSSGFGRQADKAIKVSCLKKSISNYMLPLVRYLSTVL